MTLKRVYLIWGVLALFYLLQYFMRVGPSVMMEDIRHDFNLSASQFALIPALSLYAYGFFQIPVGVFLDTIGVKRTILASIALCTLGAFLFFTSRNLYAAYCARFLIGMGSASAFITSLKVVGDHMPKQGLFMGLTLTLGTVGALLAGKPQTLIIQEIGWRNTGLLSAVIGAFIFILVYFFVPKGGELDKNVQQTESFSAVIGSLKKVLMSKEIILYAFLSACLYAPMAALSDTWGVSFLMAKYQFTRPEAAECIGFIFLGLCLGSFAVPAYFEKIKRINLGIQLASFIMAVVVSIILFCDCTSIVQLKLLFFVFGFSCGSEMLCFTAISKVAPSKLRGSSLGFTNTVNMVGGALLQHGIGVFLDIMWSGNISEVGLREYSAQNYTQALAIIAAFYVLSIILSLFLKREKQHGF